MAYNSHGKRIRSENLARQVTTTAWYDWSVTYNGENRPVLWENVSTNSPTPNSPTPSLISMSFDRMGRRVHFLETSGAATNENKVFIYDGYLQVANFDFATQNAQRFAWDPTEPIATRPLVFYDSAAPMQFYTHDGNKNVSELISIVGSVPAHYEYAAFGQIASLCSMRYNPFAFSSEYADFSTATSYYAYRHYNPIAGRWLTRDVVEDGVHWYMFARNSSGVDVKGLSIGDLIDAVVDGVVVTVKVVGDGLMAAGNGTYYGGKVVMNSLGAVMIIPTSILDGELINDMRYSDPNRGISFDDVSGCTVIISVNGMANEDGADFAARLKERWGEVAKPYHNPSNLAMPYIGGPGAGDILQSLFYESGLQDSASVDLADVIEQAYNKLKDNGCFRPCIKIYAHSQGTMLARRAFDWLKYSPFASSNPLEYVLFCGYGGETHIEAHEFGLRGSENNLNSSDPIRKLPPHWGKPTNGNGGHPFVNYVY